MNKHFVRLFVAWVCFSVSLELTSLSKLLRGVHSSIAPVAFKASVWTHDFAGDELQTRHDRAFFEQVETEDFNLVLGDSHLSREQDIRWMESSSSDIIYDNYPDRLEIFGDWAMVNGRMEARYRDSYIRQWDYIDIWVKRGGVWQIQSTTSLH